MSEKMDVEKKKCITPEFRVSFPAVFEPKAFEGKQAEYSVVMLFDKQKDLTALKKCAYNAGVEKWGPDKSKWPKSLKTPFRDGSERSDTEGYGDGVIFVTAKSKTQPGLVDQRVKDIINPEDFYAGCYARASVIAFAYDQSGNRGVSFSLQHIQKLRDGEPFGGRRNASDVFDVVKTDDDDDSGHHDDDESDSLGF